MSVSGKGVRLTLFFPLCGVHIIHMVLADGDTLAAGHSVGDSGLYIHTFCECHLHLWNVLFSRQAPCQ